MSLIILNAEFWMTSYLKQTVGLLLRSHSYIIPIIATKHFNNQQNTFFLYKWCGAEKQLIWSYGLCWVDKLGSCESNEARMVSWRSPDPRIYHNYLWQNPPCAEGGNNLPFGAVKFSFSSHSLSEAFQFTCEHGIIYLSQDRGYG